jgi:pyruvate kinase
MYNSPTLPPCKTRIVCTIGPASDSPEMLEQMLTAGMTIARLNFSHGDFHLHGDTIRRIRQGAETVGRPICPVQKSASAPWPKNRWTWPSAAASP